MKVLNSVHDGTGSPPQKVRRQAYRFEALEVSIGLTM